MFDNKLITRKMVGLYINGGSSMLHLGGYDGEKVIDFYRKNATDLNWHSVFNKSHPFFNVRIDSCAINRYKVEGFTATYATFDSTRRDI